MLSEDKLMLTHLDLMKNLVTAMAGVAAEDYVFGMLSTGGRTISARQRGPRMRWCAVYGMSQAIGPVTVGEKPGQVFIGREMANTATSPPPRTNSWTQRRAGWRTRPRTRPSGSSR